MTRRWKRLPRRRAWMIAVGAIALAAAGIVLLRGEGHAAPLRPTPAPLTQVTGQVLEFAGPGLSGQAAFNQSAIAAHGTRTVGAELRLSADEGVEAQRQPIALAIVLDTSGSMAGDKIAQARLSVLQMIERMRDEDQVALVTYDHGARVLSALAPVSTMRPSLHGVVNAIQAGGGTNIPAGLSMGASTLAMARPDLVRRLVLISDGLDGSGLALPVVSRQVRSRADTGVTTSALGIGLDYSESFLTSIAENGRGNYEFLAEGSQLAGFLSRELDQATRTVVDQVVAEVTLPDGWRLARAFGVTAEAQGQTVRLPVGALYPGVTRSVVLELEVPAGAPGAAGAMDVRVGYRTVADAETHSIGGGSLALAVVESEALAAATILPEVHAQTQGAMIDARQADAVEAWRSGDRARATQLAAQNLGSLRALSAVAPTAAVAEQLEDAEEDAANFQRFEAASAEGRAAGLRSNAARFYRSAF